MIEFHGWVTLREAYREEDEDEKSFKEAIDRIALFVDDLQEQHNVQAMLVEPNGNMNLIVNGNTNHADNRWSKVVEMFHIIARTAIGSYGLLHFHDDECQNGKQNLFQVYVLRKGLLELVDDVYLSPYFTMVEE